MITGVPAPEEFFVSGVDYLNVAWNIATKLLLERRDAVDASTSTELSQTEQDNKYHLAAQPSLNSAVTLVQQAAEFILKSRIAAVSPYLLIANTPQNYPKNSAKKDIAFADFRTIDAQDLIRVHDTVTEARLPDTFIHWYSNLRSLQNRIMHTVDKTTLITDKYVVNLLLEASEYLIGPKTWIGSRDEYLKRSPDVSLYQRYIGEDNQDILDAYRLGDLSREILNVIEILEPSKVKTFFDFDKKKKRVVCLRCLSIREKEYFFELKNEETFYLSSAYFIKGANDIRESYCLFCKKQAIIEADSS